MACCDYAPVSAGDADRHVHARTGADLQRSMIADEIAAIRLRSR